VVAAEPATPAAVAAPVTGLAAPPAVGAAAGAAPVVAVGAPVTEGVCVPEELPAGVAAFEPQPNAPTKSTVRPKLIPGTRFILTVPIVIDFFLDPG
jgi:hypothetical protein